MLKVIRIVGELRSEDYRNIQEALLQAKNDSQISAVLLDIDSSGGSAEALQETALLVRETAKVKPVYAYTQTKMLSAAYWLASQATKVLASPASVVGSIGVVAMHYDMSKKMEKEGIQVTVLRSAESKAVPNIYEPLSEEAKANLQQIVNNLHEQFVKAVKTARGLPNEDKWASGKSFGAQEAVEIGLVDELVLPFELKSYISKQNEAYTMDSGIIEQFKVALKDLFSQERKEREAQEKQIALELQNKEAEVKAYKEQLANLAQEKENLRRALREKEIREFLISSNRIYGDNLEKALAFAMSLDDEKLSAFKEMIMSLSAISTEAKFTAGASLDDDDYKRAVDALMKA
jgi:signal peptide peptidase SppA